MQGSEGPEMWLMEASNTATGTVKGLKLMAKQRNRDNRLADGSYKNFRSQVLGTARKRVFLQPR
jgi:hypothetical protein